MVRGLQLNQGKNFLIIIEDLRGQDVNVSWKKKTDEKKIFNFFWQRGVSEAYVFASLVINKKLRGIFPRTYTREPTYSSRC